MSMQFTKDEIKRACEIGVLEVLKRQDRFKPEHATAVKDVSGWICEKIYLGSVENELTFSLKIQWNYPLGGAVGRIMALVHARLVCHTNERGRFLRLQELHMPVWQKLEEKLSSGRDKKCTRCSDGFIEYEFIEYDTSLHEF